MTNRDPLAGSDDLKIDIRREGNAAVVSVEGEVTAFTSPALRKALRQAAEDKPDPLAIDLSGTPYVDSSGVATLVEGLQVTAKYGGTLVLAAMNKRVRGVLEIARLDSVFVLADSVEEALAS